MSIRVEQKFKQEPFEYLNSWSPGKESQTNVWITRRSLESKSTNMMPREKPKDKKIFSGRHNIKIYMKMRFPGENWVLNLHATCKVLVPKPSNKVDTNPYLVSFMYYGSRKKFCALPTDFGSELFSLENKNSWSSSRSQRQKCRGSCAAEIRDVL